jgi:hypothetical protein
MAIASYMQKYFWDIDPKTANPKSHPAYYIKRILEMGDKKAFGWAKRVFGTKKVVKVSNRAKLSSKSKNFWKLIFN